MQYTEQNCQQLHTWRCENKLNLRDRLLDFVRHVAVLLIMLVIMSIVQTVTAAQPNIANVRRNILIYRIGQSARLDAIKRSQPEMDRRFIDCRDCAYPIRVFSKGINTHVTPE